MTDQLEMLGPPDEAQRRQMLDATTVDMPEERWAPLLASMVDVQASTFRRLGMDDAQAVKLATAGVLAQAEYFGGRMIYLPRGDRLKLFLRDAEIYQRAKRGNIEQLAAEYGLTDIHVYRICRVQKALHLSKVQGRFNFGEQGEG